MLNLSEDVRDLFIDAQQPVFDSIWKHYSLSKAAEYERKREWDKFNAGRRKKALDDHHKRNPKANAAYCREYYAKNKDYWRKRWLMKKAKAG